ncbi:MAG: DUF2231 domain-containing protein [Cystobacter sp.]
MTTRTQELHAMLVHAPLTLLPSTVILDVAAAVSGDRSWDRTARRLWWATAAVGMVSGVAGLAASQEVRLDTQRTRDMLVQHGLGNGVIILGALGIAAWRTGHRASWVSGLLGAGSLLLVGYSAWLGGELVYSHGVGVNALTMSEEQRERRSPPLLSREAPGRLLRDAVRGFGWLMNRARRMLSSPERLHAYVLDEELPGQHGSPRPVADALPSRGDELRPV